MTENQKLLAWAASQIQAAQTPGFYGSVRFEFKDGQIISCKTEKQEKPEKQNK